MTAQPQDKISIEEFIVEVEEHPNEPCFVQVINFCDTCYQIWIGSREANLENLAFSIAPKNSLLENKTTKIFGPSVGEDADLEDTDCGLASKLSAKLKKPVYLSYNYKKGNTYQQIELSILKQIINRLSSL